MHYYQGLHDVASVLLLVAGELPAFDMLCTLATGHLRDATRPSLDPVIELLGLMGPITEAADPELAQFINQQGLPPFYALSWFITWFSHDMKDFGEVMPTSSHSVWIFTAIIVVLVTCSLVSSVISLATSYMHRPTMLVTWVVTSCIEVCSAVCLLQVCRLFDLFLATHPLMPLYVGAAAMRTQRLQLLAADEMPVLHSKLVNLSITKRASADQLAVQVREVLQRIITR